MKQPKHILFLFLALFLISMPDISRACCSAAKKAADIEGTQSCCGKTLAKATDKKCSCCNKPTKKNKKSCSNCSNACHCATYVSGVALISRSFIQQDEVSFFDIKNIYSNSPFQFTSSNVAAIWVPPKIETASI